MNNKLQIVSVVNNYETFKRCVVVNDYVNQYDVTFFDNTRTNTSISKHYNSFIRQNVNADSDFWIIFMHQDFIFLEDPTEKLRNMPKNTIYGPIGIAKRKINLSKNFQIELPIRRLTGQIIQGERENKKIIGQFVTGNPPVLTLDCCCIIVHSKLLYEKELHFDTNLNFHMYAEDFCIAATKQGIKSKIIQYECQHLSAGKRDASLERAAKYIQKKYGISKIYSTCHS